jgi:hypothetical protein
MSASDKPPADLYDLADVRLHLEWCSQRIASLQAEMSKLSAQDLSPERRATVNAIRGKLEQSPVLVGELLSGLDRAEARHATAETEPRLFNRLAEHVAAFELQLQDLSLIKG